MYVDLHVLECNLFSVIILSLLQEENLIICNAIT